jgi:hypothetical protein
MNLHAEAVVAMGDAKQLRNGTRDASSEIVLLSWGDRLGFKPNYPWDQYPSRARTTILDHYIKETAICRK